MNVTLINPNYQSFKGPIVESFKLPPLSLLNCASILKENGCEVEIIDANIEDLTDDAILSRLKAPDVVILTTSPLISWQCPPLEIDPFYALADAIKKDFNKTFLVATGPHTIFKPERLAEIVDLVILGGPEGVVRKIKPAFVAKDFLELDGVCYNSATGIVKKPENSKFQLDDLPIPALELLPYDKYWHNILGSSVTLVETSRGCPEKCPFCFKAMFPRYSLKSVEKVVAEIKYVVREFGINNVVFCDLEFCSVKKRVKKLCESIIENGLDISWICNSTVSALDEEMLNLMSKSGCKGIMFGIESGNDEIQKDFKKNFTLDNIATKLKLVNSYKILTLGYFVLGQYQETEESILKTIKFATKLPLDYASFQIAVPYPTTAFYESSMLESDVKNFSKEGLPFAYEGLVPYKRLEELQRKAFLKFYLRPGYVLTHLSFFFKPVDLLKNFLFFIRIFTKAFQSSEEK